MPISSFGPITSPLQCPVEISGSCYMELGDRADFPQSSSRHLRLTVGVELWWVLNPSPTEGSLVYSPCLLQEEPSSDWRGWRLFPPLKQHCITCPSSFLSRGVNTVLPSVQPQLGSHGYRPWQQLRKTRCQIGMGQGTEALPDSFPSSCFQTPIQALKEI